jgi:chromosomal replication initiator protein
MDEQLVLDLDLAGELAPLWEETLRLAEARLGPEATESWLHDAIPLSRRDDRLVIGVANVTARSWVEKRYSRVLAEILTEVGGAPLGLEVVVRKAGTRPPRRSTPAPAAPPPASDTRAARPAHSMFAPLPLNDRYAFDTFVTGQSNRFAQAAAWAVAENPGQQYNPLFIYGGVGLGKTHLLQAIGHHLIRTKPRVRVAYVHGETFTSHFITSLREHREEEFRRWYRSVDVWLVDDIQFIADKSGTKAEFFHTFNELHLTNRAIVLASDRPPTSLRLLEDRLRSRLESGLQVEVEQPELETRIAILQRRARLEHAQVPEEALYHIARSVTENVRVLEAALVRMLALASLTNCTPNAELAVKALGAFVQESRVASLSLLSIQRAVCAHFKISESEVTGPGRDRHTALARQVCMYLMRELTQKTLIEIGELFGGKSHSTVLYACGRMEKELKANPELAQTVRELRARLAGQGAEH